MGDRVTFPNLSKEGSPPQEFKKFISEDFLLLNKHPDLVERLMKAVVHLLAPRIAAVSEQFAWMKNVVPNEYKHDLSDIAKMKSDYSLAFLENLCEMKNDECVKLLDVCNELYLEALVKHSGDDAQLIADIKTINDSDLSDEEMEASENRVLEAAKNFGFCIIFGDLLTYERARNAKRLRKGSISIFKRFDLLKFEVGLFHMAMAKTIIHYKKLCPDLSNTAEKCTLPNFRARLFLHKITNVAGTIKKDGNWELQDQFKSACGEEALMSLMKQYFCLDGVGCDKSDANQASKTYEDAVEVILKFLDKTGIELYYDPDRSQFESFDDLEAYSTRLVSSHLLDLVHDLMAHHGDGRGLRALRRLSILQFLANAGQRSKYALNLNISEISYHISSDYEKLRNDIQATVNPHGRVKSSVDCDKFEEHKIKQVKRKMDSLHGHFDLTTIENSVKALDVQIKISENFHDELQLSKSTGSHHYDYIGDENRMKIRKSYDEVKPFSHDRQKVKMKNPVGSSIFSELKPSDIEKFISRNRRNFSKKITAMTDYVSDDDESNDCEEN